MDFEDFILRQPLSADTGNAQDGECGGTKGDSLKIKSSDFDQRMIGFDSLCGTLTGQHSKIINTEYTKTRLKILSVDQGGTVNNKAKRL